MIKRWVERRERNKGRKKIKRRVDKKGEMRLKNDVEGIELKEKRIKRNMRLKNGSKFRKNEERGRGSLKNIDGRKIGKIVGIKERWDGIKGLRRILRIIRFKILRIGILRIEIIKIFGLRIMRIKKIRYKLLGLMKMLRLRFGLRLGLRIRLGMKLLRMIGGSLRMKLIGKKILWWWKEIRKKIKKNGRELCELRMIVLMWNVDEIRKRRMEKKKKYEREEKEKRIKKEGMIVDVGKGKI